MKDHELLHLAALLHDIGKFRQRATERFKKHQEHSYEFVTEDFANFFAPCGDIFKNAIRHHHSQNPTRLQHLIEKQVILADRLSATEREDEERESEDFVQSALISPLSRLKGATKDHRYPLTELKIDRHSVIPTESADVNQDAYEKLWDEFKKAFDKATAGKHYTSAFYQTIVALLHKYTSRMPSSTPWELQEVRTVPDISLYDHLRTTAAVAACIGRELTSDTDVDALLTDAKDSHQKICALIKGDISGIQNFLYHIRSDGAANQLRGRSFYLQLLTESIAHYVLKEFDLPITNLLLASGGHFYILAPDTEAKTKLDTIRQNISKKLWELHRGDLSCMLAGISINARDFGPQNFSDKWTDVSENVQERKRRKWAELGVQDMFGNLFEPHEEPYQERENHWEFEELGKKIRRPKYLVTFKVPESPIPEKPEWRAALKAFGMEVGLCEKIEDTVEKPEHAENAVVYRLGTTDFLTDQVLENFQWENCPVTYDFRIFRPVIAHDKERIADYDYLANASEGAQWLGALRMDVDDLGKVFSKEKLGNATISRLATLSEAFRLFFEGYVPQLCREYNKQRDKEILELIYAGGDDLFLVGGWSALPEIAQKIRSEFRHFVTGDHVTLSGGIAVEHNKYPLYQFAAQSGEAEKAAKGLGEKDAITFLRKPMKWVDFEETRNWHERFLEATCAEKDPIPHGFLTRLNQIYGDERRWAWRSLYYFHRLQERYKAQVPFLRELQHELNHPTSFGLKEFIHVITRWTALQIRNQED